MFIHRNPLDNYDDYLYTLRCIQRFEKLQNYDKNIFFVHTVYDKKIENILNDNDINKMNNTLNLIYKNNYLLIINYIKINDHILNKKYNCDVYNNIIILNINLIYDNKIEYDIDHKIKNFYNEQNPINEIIKNVLNN